MTLEEFLRPFDNFHYKNDVSMEFVVFAEDCTTLVSGTIETVREYAKTHHIGVLSFWTVSNIPNRNKNDIVHCIVVE